MRRIKAFLAGFIYSIALLGMAGFLVVLAITAPFIAAFDPEVLSDEIP